MKALDFVYNSYTTHSGVFHADDVLSSALISIIGGEDIDSVLAKTERVKAVEPAMQDNGFVFDIGNGEFDHHQSEGEVREDGVKYASLGLIWKKFGKDFLQINGAMTDVAENLAKRFDKEFIEKMDLTDNEGQGKYPNPLSFLISAMNPANMRESDEGFKMAVRTIYPMVKAAIERLIREVDQISMIKEYEEEQKTNFCILNLAGGFIPAKLFGEWSDFKWVISSNPRGGWTVSSVNSQKFPISAEIGKDGCTFIHPARFMAVFQTKEDAIRCCERM